jgi:hypothetical protein
LDPLIEGSGYLIRFYRLQFNQPYSIPTQFDASQHKDTMEAPMEGTIYLPTVLDNLLTQEEPTWSLVQFDDACRRTRGFHSYGKRTARAKKFAGLRERALSSVARASLADESTENGAEDDLQVWTEVFVQK